MKSFHHGIYLTRRVCPPPCRFDPEWLDATLDSHCSNTPPAPEQVDDVALAEAQVGVLLRLEVVERAVPQRRAGRPARAGAVCYY